MTKDELTTFIQGWPDDMEIAYDHPACEYGSPWVTFCTAGELKAALIEGYVPKQKPVYEQADCGFPF
jgi:hypothetical protein